MSVWSVGESSVFPGVGVAWAMMVSWLVAVQLRTKISNPAGCRPRVP
jgi:hypothetical protein